MKHYTLVIFANGEVADKIDMESTYEDVQDEGQNMTYGRRNWSYQIW